MTARPRTVSLLSLALLVPMLSMVLTTPAKPGGGAVTAVSLASAESDPRASVRLSAPVVQPGRKPSASRFARLRGSIRFKPRHHGRPVAVQRRVEDGRWSRITTKRQNRAGVVHFTSRATAPSGEPYDFRGVARRWRGNPKVASNIRNAGVWHQAFTDEFKRKRLGPKWRDRRSDSPSRTCSKVGDRRASSVSRGTLKLRVRLNPNRRQQRCRVDGRKYRYYLNGQVSTQHLGAEGSWVRGTFAARVRFQKKRGQHGAFWMQPAGSTADMGGARASGAEIDIAEFFGKGYSQGGFASFLYNYGVRDRSGQPKKIGGLSPRATKMLPRRDNWWRRYHVVSLQWTRRAYLFMVDGRVHYRTRRGVTAQPEYMILSLLSSDWELEQARRLGIRPGASMKVDWVRVWQR
jgi:hypothetical protein